MEYQGLTTDDLAHVRALNRAWLDLAADRLPAPLSPRQRIRLAATPFLLFSFREQDAALWRRLLRGQDQQDLFERKPWESGGLVELQTAGLGFLWTLTRRSPYVARLISGAPLEWCEKLAAATLIRVLECARSREFVDSRLPSESPIHKRLYSAGSSAPRESRIAAQLAALHLLLTAGPGARNGRLRAAACRMPEPGRRLADKL